MQTTDIEILKGLISLIKVHNGKFSDTDMKLLKGIYQIVNSFDESKHPRYPKGSSKGGQFAKSGAYTEYLEGAELNKYFKESKLHKKWENNLTESEKNTIYEYTVNRYENINKFLRLNVGSESSDTKLNNEIAQLDNAIQKYELDKPVVAYRVIQNNVFKNYANTPEKLIGTTYNDKAFSSTTIMKEDVEGTPDTALIKMNIPKGKGKGMYINNFSEYKDMEHEFLVKRDSNFKITNAYKKDGVLNIEMELTN